MENTAQATDVQTFTEPVTLLVAPFVNGKAEAEGFKRVPVAWISGTRADVQDLVVERGAFMRYLVNKAPQAYILNRDSKNLHFGQVDVLDYDNGGLGTISVVLRFTSMGTRT